MEEVECEKFDENYPNWLEKNTDCLTVNMRKHMEREADPGDIDQVAFLTKMKEFLMCNELNEDNILEILSLGSGNSTKQTMNHYQ